MSVRLNSARTFVVAIGVFACFAVPDFARAAEWIAEPSIAASREYHDNINLAVTKVDSVYGSIVTPRLEFGINTPIWTAGAGVSATQRRYSGQSGLNRDDYSLNLASTYQAERQTWQLNAGQTRESLLSRSSISSDTGLVQAQQQVDSRTVSPSWIWSYSETIQLQMNYQWSDVSYKNLQNSSLYDYRNQSATATLTKLFSERFQFFVTGGYAAFDVPFTGFRSNTSNIQTGVTRFFSDTSKGTLQAGLRSTESITPAGVPEFSRFSTDSGDVQVQTGVTTQDARRRKTGSVLSGNFEKKYEKAIIKMSLSQSLNPSGSGGQIKQDRFDIAFSDPLTQRLTLTMYANAQKSSDFEGNITNNGLKYYDFSSSLDWQWLQDWNVMLRYRYARVKRVFETTAADSNSVYLTFYYRPLKFSTSH